MRLSRFVFPVVGGFVALAVILGVVGVVGCDRAREVSRVSQLWHCGMHPQVIQDHPGDCPICHMALTPLVAGAAADAGAARGDAGPAVTIDPTVVQNMGVRTAAVTRGPLHKTVRTFGLLKIPEPATHEISLKVSGWIDVLHADQEGIHVEAGQPLFELYSPELQVAAQELISAVKSEKALGAGAGEAVREQARGMIDSAKRKLRLWDVAEEDVEKIAKSDQPPKDVTFRSPIFGHVEEKMVFQGSAVQPGMKLMRIADHTKMWLDVQVYEEQFSFVKVGQAVAATIDGAPGRQFNGAINFVYPHIDHMTRTFTVRVSLDNPDFALRPGMYATAQIATRPAEDAVQVPREAVIDTGARQITFVADAAGRYTPRKVRMGMSGDDDKVQILEGLAPGETVVTSGQFLMDVESRTIEATQKLTQPGAAGLEAPAPAPAPATAPQTAPAPAAPMDMGPDHTGKAAPTVAPPTAPAASQPARVESLSLVYCPMKKADWLQTGDAVRNPFFGSQMLDCGTVKKKVTSPAAGSALEPVVRSYLEVQTALSGDKLNVGAVQALKSATDTLEGARYAELRKAAAALAAAKDVKEARTAFVPVSAAVIAAVDAGR